MRFDLPKMLSYSVPFGILYFIEACVNRIFCRTTESMASRNWSAVHDGAFNLDVVSLPSEQEKEMQIKLIISAIYYSTEAGAYSSLFIISWKLFLKMDGLRLAVLCFAPSDSGTTDDSEWAFGSIQWKPCRFLFEKKKWKRNEKKKRTIWIFSHLSQMNFTTISLFFAFHK